MGREWYRSMMTKGHHHKQGSTTVGCMSGMLQLFDFHRVVFTGQTVNTTTRAVQDSSSSSPVSHLKGLEAPRNSLELDETAASAKPSVSTSSTAEEFYGIPVGITIKKKRADLHLWVEEEDEEYKRNCSSQAGTPRTPNVVARLMGLEILPDGATTPSSTLGGFKSLDHSPKISSRTRKIVKKNVVVKDKQCIDESPPPQRRPLQNVMMGSRSLPDTPRASSERSRDVDPRLSFQMNSFNNKENYCCNNRAKELAYLCEVQRKSYNQEENTRSPRSQYYALEIMKQVKESVNQRGLVNSNSNGCNSTEIRSKRMRPTDKKVDHEIKSFTAMKPRKIISQAESRRENAEAKGIKQCKKSNYELRFNERVKKPPPQADIAVRSDAVLGYPKLQLPPFYSSSNVVALPQKPLSNYEGVRSITTVTATATKREASCGPPLRRDQLLNRSGPLDPRRTHHQSNKNYSKETNPEFQYVRSILDHAGITGTTRVRWYSPSLPVDPFVFHQLELDRSHNRNHHSTLRCNRKLLFHLVEEILSDLLTTKQQKDLLHINRDRLLDRVWSQIKNFPSADCQVIADIDELVAGDLEAARVRRLLGHPSVVAEAENIALEIEEEVVDSVIGETTAFLAL